MAIIPPVTVGNTKTTAAKPMMNPTACATQISPHTSPQDRLSTWSTTTADIGEYAMLIVAWQTSTRWLSRLWSAADRAPNGPLRR